MTANGTMLNWQGVKRTPEAPGLMRGMYLRMHPNYSVVFCCFAKGRYADKELADGTFLYCGHDTPGKPKFTTLKLDQPLLTKSCKLTQNTLFLRVASEAQQGFRDAESMRIFEKISVGIWRDRNFYWLTGYKEYIEEGRKVYRFIFIPELIIPLFPKDDSNSHKIPAAIRAVVWERDWGRCQECGSTQNLTFDHINPVSLGMSSNSAANVQILCARCNAAKGTHIDFVNLTN